MPPEGNKVGATEGPPEGDLGRSGNFASSSALPSAELPLHNETHEVANSPIPWVMPSVIPISQSRMVTPSSKFSPRSHVRSGLAFTICPPSLLGINSGWSSHCFVPLDATSEKALNVNGQRLLEGG